MKQIKMNRVIAGVAAAFAVGACGLMMVASTAAREPYTKAELADQNKALLAAVDHGRDLWHGSLPSMSGNGLACGNCHPDAAASNPNTFPKFQADLGKVVSLRDMINWCITVPQGGQPLDVNGDDMIAMEAYAFNLYRGETIQPGLATVQTSPIKVKSGVGYPKHGSQIGFDKEQ